MASATAKTKKAPSKTAIKAEARKIAKTMSLEATILIMEPHKIKEYPYAVSHFREMKLISSRGYALTDLGLEVKKLKEKSMLQMAKWE